MHRTFKKYLRVSNLFGEYPVNSFYKEYDSKNNLYILYKYTPKTFNLLNCLYDPVYTKYSKLSSFKYSHIQFKLYNIILNDNS